MERLICLVVLVWWGGGAAGEPLGAALRRRSDGGGVYAQRFARSYEPAVFVALPLHRPIPVLQLLSASAAPPAPPEPPSAPTIYAASTSHATFAQPARPQGAAGAQSYYSKTTPQHYERTSTWYGNKQHSETSPWYRAPSAADTSPPTRYGQRLAARRPSPAPASAPPQAPAATAWQEQPAPQEAPDFYESPIQEQQNAPAPVILYARPTEHGGYEYRKRPARPPRKAVPIVIRIHKHRIVRDD